MLGLIIAKSLMWAFSLSSGTSGGVLAPLLMIGAAMGESAAHLAHLPGETQALWALMGMGAMLAGALGVPLTAVLFSLELTHALPAMLPLMLACTASYLVTSLHHAAFDSYRETRPPRISSLTRIRRRSA